MIIWRGDFIDWYGTEFMIESQDEKFVSLRIRVNENAVYYWAIQYGEIAEVVKPATLRKRIYEGLKGMMGKYEEE